MSIIKTLRGRTELLKIAELSKMMAVTEATVQKWAREKRIPCIRIGDTIRFDSEMLADWIEARAACSHAPKPDESEIHWQDLGHLAPEDEAR